MKNILSTTAIMAAITLGSIATAQPVQAQSTQVSEKNRLLNRQQSNLPT